MRTQTISRNSGDPGLMDYLGERGARWEMEAERHEPWRSGVSRDRLYSWKVIPRETREHGNYILIHVTPGRIKDDPGPIAKLKEAIKTACSLDLQNTRFHARSVDEPEFGVCSFCISFFKTHHWRELSELFLADVEKHFLRWMH